MKNRLMWVAMLMWLAATFMMWRTAQQQQNAEPPKPATVVLAQLEAREKAAGDDARKLQAIIKEYERVASTYKKTEYAAQARLRIGIIQEEKLHQTGVSGSKRAKTRQGALTTYTQLLREFSPEKSEAAKEAKIRLERLEHQIDKENSKHILYKVMDALVKATGARPSYSYALALLLMTLFFKVVTTPLSHLQFKYMREMQKLQPLVKQLQEKYKNNQKELGPKLMALYKEHNVSPFASCLPVLIQLPVLYMLYWMVRLYQFKFEMGHFLWINPTFGAKWPAIIAPSLAHADIPLLLLYVISMFISQKLTIVDPTQAEQQKVMTYTMPVIFGFLFWKWAFPSAFMLYWLFFNIISTAHQYWVLRPAFASSGDGGPGAGAAGVLPGGPAETTEQPVKRAPASPGKKSKRRKKKAVVAKLARPDWKPIASPNA